MHDGCGAQAYQAARAYQQACTPLRLLAGTSRNCTPVRSIGTSTAEPKVLRAIDLTELDNSPMPTPRGAEHDQHDHEQDDVEAALDSCCCPSSNAAAAAASMSMETLSSSTALVLSARGGKTGEAAEGAPLSARA